MSAMDKFAHDVTEGVLRDERDKDLEMSTPITDLDYALMCAVTVIDTTNARAELAALRARVAELERDIICAFCGTHYHADDVPPEHWRTCEHSPLVQAVNEAREIMATVSLEADPFSDRPIVRRYAIDECDAWLAAHPAPEPPPC